MERILAGSSISITELKRNPSAVPAADLAERMAQAAQRRSAINTRPSCASVLSIRTSFPRGCMACQIATR
jgi:hypothetical protein